MSWWSTVIGGAVGFMIGGPLGAMLGVAFAGNFSKRRANSGFNGNFGPGNQQRVQAAFFSGVFSVMGYISKVDGKVSKSDAIDDRRGQDSDAVGLRTESDWSGRLTDSAPNSLPWSRRHVDHLLASSVLLPFWRPTGSHPDPEADGRKELIEMVDGVHLCHHLMARIWRPCTVSAICGTVTAWWDPRSLREVLTEQGIEPNPGPAASRPAFGLRFETANATDKGPMLTWLGLTEAHVVIGQELKVLASELEAFKAQVWTLGWRCVVAPCRLTEAGGRSAGVGIFARRWMALWIDPEIPWAPVEFRSVWAMVAGNGLPTTAVGSIYLRTAEGASVENLNILGKTLHAVVRRGCPFILGGDFNMHPQAILDTDLPRVAGSRLVFASLEELTQHY